jgi:hypothetical protein
MILQRFAVPLVATSASSPAHPRRAFVLMPFRPTWSGPVYEMVKRAAEGLDLTVGRADDIATPGRITDQIVEAIGTADVIVADITDLNPNVMWEVGVAHALGKQVVILNQHIDGSPFDIRDYRQIQYDENPTTDNEHALVEMLRSSVSLERGRPATPGDA